MTVNKPASHRTLGSDLKRVDAHVVQPDEYDELPELTEEMFPRVIFKKAGRPKLANPHGQAARAHAFALRRK